MVYALNVYDIIADKEAVYADYAQRAGAVLQSYGATMVAAGHNPLKQLAGQARNHFALVQFKDLSTFEAAMETFAERDLHRLREDATENYIWTIYESWNFGD